MNAPRPPLMTLDEALPGLLARAQRLAGTELVATFDADGRVLATSSYQLDDGLMSMGRWASTRDKLAPAVKALVGPSPLARAS